MAETQSSELVIRRLYEITNDYKKGMEHQITELIKLGLERFNLDIGILSQINGDDYKVLYCVTPENVDLNAGDHFDYNATYCEITCSARGPVCIEHMGKDDKLATHPAYKAFGLESYIGVPICFDGKVFGTLNFSSPTPYPRKFLDVDIDALKLMVSWIEVELIRREQETQLNKLNKELTRLANYDALTNVINRRGLYEELHKGLNYLSRSKGEGALAMIDIDHFKTLNDTYGHQVGDNVLIDVAKLICDSLRDYDLVARYGGEEFLLWLPGASLNVAESVCKRVMDGIADINITNEKITVSVGVYHFNMEKSHSIDLTKRIYSLIKEADDLLYKAKHAGRNRVMVGAES